MVRVRLLQAGFTQTLAWLVDGSDWRKSLNMPALAAVVEHPLLGSILFDTGYGQALADSQALYTRLYRLLLPFRLGEAITVRPDLIFLSHLHPDHIGGLREVAGSAPIVCAEAGWRELESRSPLSRARSAYFSELLPDDFGRRLRPLEAFGEVAVDPFGLGYDLAGDGSLVAVPLPGHAVGQYGLLCRISEMRRVFLVADAAWVRSNISQSALPQGPARFLMEDWTAYVDTLEKLRQFARTNPDVVMIPSHCEASIAAYAR